MDSTNTYERVSCCLCVCALKTILKTIQFHAFHVSVVFLTVAAACGAVHEVTTKNCWPMNVVHVTNSGNGCYYAAGTLSNRQIVKQACGLRALCRYGWLQYYSRVYTRDSRVYHAVAGGHGGVWILRSTAYNNNNNNNNIIIIIIINYVRVERKHALCFFCCVTLILALWSWNCIRT